MHKRVNLSPVYTFIGKGREGLAYCRAQNILLIIFKVKNRPNPINNGRRLKLALELWKTRKKDT